MPEPTRVSLPRGYTAVFPDQCCACSRPRPGNVVAFKGRRISFLELWAPWQGLFGERIRVEVPACDDCSRRIRRQRRWQNVVWLAALLPVAVLVYSVALRAGIPPNSAKLVSLVGTVILLAPLWLWMMAHPPAFDLTVGKERVDYEFASPQYAAAFRDRNPQTRAG